MLRLPSQRRKRGWLPTSSSKPAQPSSARDAAHVELLPSPTERRMCTTPTTTCHPHPKPTRPGARDCQVPPTLGISALCAARPQGRSRRLCPQPHCEVNHRSEGNMPTAIGGVEHREVQVTDHHICGHPSPCLPTHARCSTLKCESPPPQCPRSGARSTVVAKRVDWEATTARVRRKRKWKTEATQQHHPEQVWWNLRQN